ncbi:hypothetical protein DL95DRAFT_456458 [Leptodontidium sp. 2 PMI_412]|nr:hypothetical protein DL95DRAFT_456458 [Leptodontidium sp. 2 PMI_412]
MLKAIVPLGCMASSAMVSPILFELRKIWFPDVFIFFVSSTAFLLQHLAEVKTYGPFTLILAAIFGIAAFSSARSSLKELTPWIPIALCLLYLLTAFSLPRLHEAFKDPVPEVDMEEGHSNAFRGPTGVPRSVRSDELHRPRERSLEMDQLLILNIAEMGRPESRLSRGFSVHDSDIDLNDYAQTAGIALRRMVSPSRENYIPRTSSHGALHTYFSGYPQGFLANRPSSDHTSQDMNYSQRSSSPESLGSQTSQSSSGELEGLLRG